MKKTKQPKQRFLTKTIVANSEFSEIDFTLQDEFKIKSSMDYVLIENGSADVKTHPIKIDTVITELQRFKDMGATHVDMDYHVDHIGYEFTASRITDSTADEIEAEVAKAADHNEKVARINALQIEIESIRKTIPGYNIYS